MTPTRKTAWNRKASDEDIIAAYCETGTVWKAAKRLGMCGQSIHERLRAIGYPLARRVWTNEETDELAALVANGVPLAEIAYRLGRTYAGVACRASEVGVRSTMGPRTKKIPRGIGLNKAEVHKHLKALEASGIKPTIYARQHGYDIDTLVRAIQNNFPERWQSYLETHAPLPQKQCTYCGQSFIPANGKQRFCTRQCGETGRRDQQYFGGQRATTIGLAEGVCQLCGAKDVPGLSSHHVLGKENDPLNSQLVALCRGCHKIITFLGSRNFVDNPRAWEALIALTWMRKHGAKLFATPAGTTVYTEVTIETWDFDEDTDVEASDMNDATGATLEIVELPLKAAP